ncbi:hypothetical protein L0222_26760 [bacterium]|nr:hypothetical protein [bacterium]MCI0605474.1 hypothetical protein [bacterium]
MNSRIIVDGKELKLNRFIADLTANVVDAIARSLKYSDGNKIHFRLRNEELQMFVDDSEIALNLGHASKIVGDVLKGLLKNLYGAEDAKEIDFVCERTS